jgi:hypothetical protein
MARGLFDNRKRLGSPVVWTCGVCGKKIRAHATTIALARLNHARMEFRQGKRKWGHNHGDDLKYLY